MSSLLERRCRRLYPSGAPPSNHGCPSDPYSINIWGLGIGPDLYIATRVEGTRWTKTLAADPSVRVCRFDRP